jgi:uncharacterized protein DUF1579
MPEHASTVADSHRGSPAPEHQRLEVFLGRWRTEGQTIADGGAKPLPVHSSDVYEWLPGGHFVVHRWDGQVGNAEVHGLEIIGVDKSSGAYRTHFFDNDGNSGSEELSVRDRTWVWLGRSVMGSDWHRCTSIVSSDSRSMAARHERSTDGKTWTPWMEVTLRRED